MTLAQLRTFLALADTGSVRAAAAALVVTEPSVSAAVASLSREIGVPLTERAGRGIRLTDAGRELARHAARILGLADRARRAALEAAGGAGHLRLVAVTTAGEYVLPPLLAELLRAEPSLQLSIEVVNRATALARLLGDQADLGFGGRAPAGGELVAAPFRDNDLVVVGASGHPLRSRRGFDPKLLSSETWLLREPGSGTRETTEEFLASAGVQPASTMNVGGNGAIKRAVSLGLGVTLISADAVSEELASGELCELRAAGTPLRRYWHVLWRKDASLPRSARSLLQILLPEGHPAIP